MQLQSRVFELEYNEPFVISRSSDTSSEVVQVAIRHGDLTGYGEGAPDNHYDESIESAMRFLGQVEPLLGSDPLAIEAILGRVGEIPGEMAAKCAVDGALHDLLGKVCGQPLYRILGLDPTPPPTSYTISIDSIEGTARRAAAASAYHALKIKVGGPGDLERVRTVRAEAPDSLIRVDANEAWSVHSTIELVPELESLGVELIEQPLPAGADAALAGPRPVPVCADESLHDRAGLDALVGRYDAVNIKLDKAGGLTETLALAAEARRCGFRIMVGCMVSTSLAMAPAMLIAQGADWVDLDGPLLLARDREPCMRYEGALVHPPEPQLWG